MIGHVYPQILGRLGNTLYSTAAALAYSMRHGLKFSMPSQTTDSFWKPTYLSHLVDPTFNPNLPNVIIQEKGYPYREIPFRPGRWAKRFPQGYNLLIAGYCQSPLYFDDQFDAVINAFGFPWQMRKGWTAVHLRRGDYLKHITKHPKVEDAWYFSQMDKIVRDTFPEPVNFFFFSDDLDYCRKTFGHLGNAFFPSKSESPEWFNEIKEDKPEVRDLVAMSQCANLIGSASTFAVWAGILNRNPNKRVIIPREWICAGWEGTTAETWRDVVPSTFERA